MEHRTPEKPHRQRLETIRTMSHLAIQHAIDTLLTALVNTERAVFTDSWWQQQRAIAQAFMAERSNRPYGTSLLIVTAQHPLNGDKPGDEFAARLTACADRAKALAAHGATVEIYVPGSRHMHEGVTDPVSLSTAGTAFLQKCSLPPNVTIHGDNLNQTYKGDDGVYNSADEAFVSAQYFIHTPTFGDIEVFCSPAQQERWELHAIAQGILPRFTPITPPDIEMYHTNPGRNENKVTAYTRRLDPTWQSPKSLLGQGSRLIRQPK